MLSRTSSGAKMVSPAPHSVLVLSLQGQRWKPERDHAALHLGGKGRPRRSHSHCPLIAREGKDV